MPDYQDRTKQETDDIDLSKGSFADSKDGNDDDGWDDLKGPKIDRDAERRKLKDEDSGNERQDTPEQDDAGSNDTGEDAWRDLEGPHIDRNAERKNLE